MTDNPQTIIDKIWQSHIVTEQPDTPAVLYPNASPFWRTRWRRFSRRSIWTVG